MNSLKKNCSTPPFGASGSMLLLFLLLSILKPLQAVAQEEYYDEVPLLVIIQGAGSTELQAVVKEKDAYLPVKEFFDFIKIKNTVSQGAQSVSGFFMNPSAEFQISKEQHYIKFQGKTYNLSPQDLVLIDYNLYLKADYFDKVFGLNCTFNYRSLIVTVRTNHELPVIREQRLERMRHNINRLTGDVKADTIIATRFNLLRIGAADWSVTNTNNFSLQEQEQEGTQQQNWQHTRLNLNAGAIVAGGEMNVGLNYSKDIPFILRNQHYIWNRVQNENPILRQIKIGRINTQATSSIFSPVTGIQLTNAASGYRQSFGTYRISDITEPDWIVELYINNTLVDYVRADKNGHYNLEVPLVFGSSAIKLHFYGPWGEERVEEKVINIPFNFVAPKTLEYTVSAAMVEDYSNTQFYRSNFNYGLSRYATVGVGMEYLSSVPHNPFMPFVNTSFTLSPSLIVSAEHMHQVRSKGTVSYKHPSNLGMEIMYARYKEGQKSIMHNFLEERKVVISKPIQAKKVSLFGQLAVHQIVFPATQNTRAEFLLSGSYAGVSTSLNSYVIFNDINTASLFSNLSLSYSTRSQYNFTVQGQYQHNYNQFSSLRASADKKIGEKAFLTASYEENFLVDYKSFELGFRYDLSFAQTSLLSRFSNNNATLYQTARGGLNYDRNRKAVKANRRTNVGQGGISVVSFLDLNNNNRRDAGEPKVSGIEPRINGGRFELSEKDTIYSASNLAPYHSYVIELNQSLLQTISWQVNNKTIKVNVEPNHHKLVEVPVSVVGEVSGTVYDVSANSKRGFGRIKVNIYREDKKLVGSTITDEDGYFYYFGLPPGVYTARIDAEQIHRANLAVLTESQPFTIKVSHEGDLVDDLEFHLRRQ